MKKLQVEFIEPQKEVGLAKFYEMLEVLPPARMAHGGFLVGEPVDYEDGTFYATYDFYFHKNGAYFYGGAITTEKFDLLTVPNETTHA